jgi:hypothetical protein
VCCFSIASTCLAYSVGVALGGFTQTLPPPDCFVCVADLLRVHSTAHRQLPGLFSCPYHDELASNATFRIGFQLACDRLPSGCRYPCSVCVCVLFCFVFVFVFFFLLVLLVYFLVFLFFPSCCLVFFFFFSFISTYVFIPISTCNKALSSLFDLPGSALVQTLGCGCERFPSFRVEDDEF